MDIQLKKGLLDAYVLALLNKEDAYGYSLLQKVGEVMEISESSLYPVLRRLETQGLLETYHLESGGRLRKYYRMTGEGVVKLAAYKRQCYDLKRIIDVIFKEEGIHR